VKELEELQSITGDNYKNIEVGAVHVEFNPVYP
jgi:hypothetical protein